MTLRVGINGFGRIGRTCLGAALDHAEAGTQDVHVVAINDPWQARSFDAAAPAGLTMGPRRTALLVSA